MPITDPSDDRLADYRALTDVELRTRWEPPHGLFIAEGELVLGRALRAGYRPRSVLVDAKRVDQVPDVDAPLYAATQDVLEATTGFHVHRGILASFHRRPLPDAASVLAAATRVAILEDVNNHTNLGAVFRGAAAFAVPYARLEPWPAGLETVRAAGFTVLALTPAPDALPIQRLDQQQRHRPALLLGAEGPGLSRAALDASDRRVTIPMRRGVDSLNVAAAAAVAFWELTRD
ncbi:MAG: rRNA methyltransferase [Actinobacteria bacterium 13_1_20CM_3_71_11]|nr:MAG: rRNA methyltransferase [Actinobacteria bacterium 13_1_20CM_3_71_11]